MTEETLFIHPSNSPLGNNAIINLNTKFPHRETLSILGGFMLGSGVFRGNPHLYIGDYLINKKKVKIGITLTYDGFNYTNQNEIQLLIDNNNDGLFSEDEVHESAFPLSIGDDAFIMNKVFFKNDNLYINLIHSDKNVENPTSGFPIPDFELTTVKDGKTYNISEFIGDILVLNFWGISCMPCRMEIPYLNELKRDFDNHSFFNFDASTMTVDDLDSMIPYKVRFLALAPYDSKENINKFTTEEISFEYEQFIISKDAMDIMNFNSIPYNMIVDKNGIIQIITSGFGPGAEKELIIKLKNKIEGRE